MTTRLTNRWPRIKSRKNGTRIVKGWYTVQWRYALVHKAAGIILRFIGGLVLLMAYSPLMGIVFGFIPEGTVWYLIASELAQLRQWPLVRLHEVFPEYTEHLWLDPYRPLNWGYLLVGFIMYRMTGMLSGPLAHAIGLLLPPLIKRRIKVRINDRCVRFWLTGIPRRFVRQPGVVVQFLCEQEQNHLNQPPDKQPSFVTVMRYGHRRIVLAASMHQQDASRLARGLSHARDLADGVHAQPGQGGMPHDFVVPMGF
ncbi:MAG: hypothetical protein KC996_04710 [Phycisphaerales bacterium]|nr:hypothetical protein [Phycisphaerales bacterium]